MPFKSIGNETQECRGNSYNQCDNGRVRETRAELEDSPLARIIGCDLVTESGL